VLTISAYDRHVEQLFDVLTRLAKAFAQAGIEYRVVGGVAVFLHVHERDPLAARTTRDIDLVVDRADLARIAEAVRSAGFECRHAAGVDLLVDTQEPDRRSAAHFVFVGEKVRPDYEEAVPEFSAPVRTQEGVLLAPARDLIRMKLTSFRLRDRVHLQDMDAVGLITPEIEAELPGLLRARLKEVRAAE
jgi:hypothetical protein